MEKNEEALKKMRLRPGLLFKPCSPTLDGNTNCALALEQNRNTNVFGTRNMEVHVGAKLKEVDEVFTEACTTEFA